MARVSLLFEDAEDGQIEFRADYHGGFEAGSHAHKISNQVIKFLDDQAAKKEKVVVDTNPPPDMEKIARFEAEKARGVVHPVRA